MFDSIGLIPDEQQTVLGSLTNPNATFNVSMYEEEKGRIRVRWAIFSVDPNEKGLVGESYLVPTSNGYRVASTKLEMSATKDEIWRKINASNSDSLKT